MSRRIYWDSCVFIDRIARTPGRIDILEQITDGAAANECTIVTSMLTIAETVRLKKSQESPDVQSNLIFRFFENSWIELVEVDSWVAEHAHKLVRDFKLKAPDAIHVATALLRGAEVLHTYDGDGPNSKSYALLKQNGKIGTPPLKIIKPKALDPQLRLGFGQDGVPVESTDEAAKMPESRKPQKAAKRK